MKSPKKEKSQLASMFDDYADEKVEQLEYQYKQKDFGLSIFFGIIVSGVIFYGYREISRYIKEWWYCGYSY